MKNYRKTLITVHGQKGKLYGYHMNWGASFMLQNVQLQQPAGGLRIVKVADKECIKVTLQGNIYIYTNIATILYKNAYYTSAVYIKP